MAVKSLQAIETLALERFDLLNVCLIHRYGALVAGDQIVLVAAAARHRQAAFDGAAFMMDHLKSRAPFWKLENGQWVEAGQSDKAALQAWD